MSKVKTIVSLFALVIMLNACESNRSGVLNENMEYKFIRDAQGEKTTHGDYLSLNVVYKDSKDSVLANTNELGIPYMVRKDTLWGKKGTFEDCLNLMDTGDSVEFKVIANQIFTQHIPPGINPDDVITVYAGLGEILTAEEYSKKVADWRNIQRVRQVEEYKASLLLNNRDRIEADGKIIDEYLAANNLTAEQTESGLRYIIKEKGDGAQAKSGDYVAVHYEGRLMDGTLFDTSYEDIAKAEGTYNAQRQYQPYGFDLGYLNVILGWDEGIALLTEGTKATLYIPSTLGYGERGSAPDIGPNAILVFNVELVGVNKR